MYISYYYLIEDSNLYALIVMMHCHNIADRLSADVPCMCCL